MTAKMILHAGEKLVDRDEVAAVPEVEGTATWFPTPHIQVLNTVEGRLGDAGFVVSRSQYALSKDGGRFFGTLDLSTPIVDGVSLSVGVRNSIDQSFPIGLAAGSRVFVCDNLAFNSDIYVSKKHTRHGRDRFDEGITRAMVGLSQFKAIESQRIDRYQSAELSDDKASAAILHAYEHKIVSSLLLPDVIAEWRVPRHAEFEPRTAWSLFNSFTEILKQRQSNPAKFSAMTMDLYRLIDGVVGFDAKAVSASVSA